MVAQEALRQPERQWREAVLVILATFLGTRLLVILIAALVEYALPTTNVRPSFSTDPIIATLTGSDSVFLLGIASSGYHALPVHDAYLDWAFFPLYPILVRLLSIATFSDIAVAGVILANGATLAAAWVLYRLGSPQLGHRTALLGVVYVLLAPGAVAFAMAYTDSLFLLLALLAFIAGRQRRWWLMGIAYALATLTRLPGIALGIPLLILVLKADGRTWRSTLPLSLGPIALAAFTAYLWDRFDVPFAYLRAQAPWTDLSKTVAGGGLPPGTETLVAILIGTLLFYTFLLVYARTDRLDAPTISLMVVSLLTILGSGRLLSVGRYLAVAWPFAWVIAKRGGWTTVIGPAISGALFSLMALLNFTQTLAP